MKNKPTNKENILNTAKKLFYTYGFQATTTRQIADTLETSQSNIFYYFKTKEDIFKILLSEYYTNLSRLTFKLQPDLTKVDLLLSYSFTQIYSLHYNKKFRDLFLEAGDLIIDVLYNDFTKDLYATIETVPLFKDKHRIDSAVIITAQNQIFKINEKEQLNISFEQTLEYMLDLMIKILNIDQTDIDKSIKKAKDIARKIDYSQLNIFSDDYWISL